ncbi:MAG: proline racemase family protein [Synergistaceae bacterium]|jgi:proline racemase|nr:proline racemase family protein [Synergistaceae bacterium]
MSGLNGFKKLIQTVDTHTGGQPTRTVVSGMPQCPGTNMSEKMLYMKDNYDDIREFLISEPRGAPNTSLAILAEPTLSGADAGVFYCESHGYMPMCGHNTIGVATMMVETGMVRVEEPETRIALETPAGMVNVTVSVKNGHAVSVSFLNVPALVLMRNIETEFLGNKIRIDVTYGGNIYAVVRAADLGIEISPENVGALIDAGLKIKEEVNKRYDITHPEKTYLKGVGLVQIVDPVTKRDGGLISRNAVVYPPGEIDRSPCGTGTSGRLALLFENGEMKPGERLTNYSIIGSSFIGRINEIIDSYHGQRAIIPEITGNAHITGYHTFVYEPGDNLSKGFRLFNLKSRKI